MEYTGKVFNKKGKYIVIKLNQENSLNNFVQVKNTIDADISDEVKLVKTSLNKSKWCTLFYFLPLFTTIFMFLMGILLNNQILQYVLMVCGFLIGFLVLVLIDVLYIKKDFKFELIKEN